MSQVAYIEVNGKWEKVETLIGSSFDDSKTYQFENHGYGVIYLLESSLAPSEYSEAGIKLQDSSKVVQYKKGSQDLYVRADSYAHLNISVIGE